MPGYRIFLSPLALPKHLLPGTALTAKAASDIPPDINK